MFLKSSLEQRVFIIPRPVAIGLVSLGTYVEYLAV